MGRLQAEEMAGLLDLDTALYWHLTSNHYPPLPETLVDCAKTAIRFVEAGDWDAPVPLPAGVSYKGSNCAPARACIEQWHLEAFLDPDLESE